MDRRRFPRGDDPDVWPDDPVISGVGCIQTLTEYTRARRVKRKGPRVRMGFHPPERAYEEDE